jgi:hypothetical protein
MHWEWASGTETEQLNFCAKVFNAKKLMSMPVSNMGQGGWTEDIDTFSGTHSSALILVAWTDRRNFKIFQLN